MTTKMNLMHVELLKEVTSPVSTFIPRIPGKKAPGEDSTSLRICTSTSIENCSHAHPNIGLNLLILPKDRRGSDGWMEYFHYFFELGTHGMLLRVYHFEVDSSIVKTSDELAKEGAVPDVLFTDEHWMLEPVKPTRISYAIINARVGTEDTSDIVVIKETDTLAELGTFMNLPTVDSYLHANRKEHGDKLLQAMSKAKSQSLKEEIELFFVERERDFIQAHSELPAVKEVAPVASTISYSNIGNLF